MSIFPDRADLDSPGYLEKRDRISPVMGMSCASAKQVRLLDEERWSRQSDSNRRPADYKFLCCLEPFCVALFATVLIITLIVTELWS